MHFQSDGGKYCVRTYKVEENKVGERTKQRGENARAELAARRATEICHFAKKKLRRENSKLGSAFSGGI